jgi:hypothetical protein
MPTSTSSGKERVAAQIYVVQKRDSLTRSRFLDSFETPLNK